MTSWPLAGASAVSELWRILRIEKGVTAIIGSGGKTSLMLHLCRELPGSVIVCTSTHILPPADLPLETGRLTALPCPKLCAGTPAEQGKLTAPVQSFEALASLADFVLVEADGSRRLPLKAHLPHEPVIPPRAGQVIQVLGLSGLGKPIRVAAHRSQQYAQLCDAKETDAATPERAAAVLKAEGLYTQVVLNQADGPAEQAQGRQLAALLDCPVTLTSLKKGWWEPINF